MAQESATGVLGQLGQPLIVGAPYMIEGKARTLTLLDLLLLQGLPQPKGKQAFIL